MPFFDRVKTTCVRFVRTFPEESEGSPVNAGFLSAKAGVEFRFILTKSDVAVRRVSGDGHDTGGARLGEVCGCDPRADGDFAGLFDGVDQLRWW